MSLHDQFQTYPLHYCPGLERDTGGPDVVALVSTQIQTLGEAGRAGCSTCTCMVVRIDQTGGQVVTKIGADGDTRHLPACLGVASGAGVVSSLVTRLAISATFCACAGACATSLANSTRRADISRSI